MAATSSINPQLIQEIVRRIVDVSQPESEPAHPIGAERAEGAPAAAEVTHHTV